MKLKQNSIYLIGILVVLLSIAFYNYLSNNHKNLVLKELKIDAQKEFQSFNSSLNVSLEEYETILSSILSNKFFNEYLDEKNKDYQIFSKDENFFYKQELLEDLFLTLAKNNRDLFQLRYLDKFGKEVIRVDKKFKEVQLVKELQNKSNRYYFIDTKKIKANSFWYSYLDLNVEYGEIEVPYKPTLRIGTPVYTNGQFDGILIVNINMENTLAELLEEKTFKKIILDKDNHILMSNDKTIPQWSKYLKTPKYVQQEYETLLFIENIDLENKDELKLEILYDNKKLAKITNDYENSILINFIIVNIFVLFILLFLLKNTYLKNAIDKAIRNKNELADKINSFVIMSKTDLKGNITYVTDEFCRLTEYSREELLGRNHRIIKDSKIKNEVYKNLWDTIKEGKDFHGNLSIITKNRKRRYWDINIYPEKDENNEITGYIAYRKDNTSEIILEEHNKILAKRVQEKTSELENTIKQLNITNEQLANLNEELSCSDEELRAQQEELIENQDKILELSNTKEQFLSNMSHEIRTPLNGIVGITDILLADKKCPEKIKERLNIIKSSSRILRNVVNDILDFTALKSGKINIFENNFSLKQLISNVDSLMRPQIESKGLRFIVDYDKNISPVLLGDEFRINQIIMNLLSNSAKFTNDGFVKLSVSLSRKGIDTEKIKISVIDSGIGMDEDIKKNIFTAFTQNDKSNTSKFRGTGLGLSITKQLVELMNGNIWFESNLNKGTMMFFNLDLKVSKSENSITEQTSNKLLKLKNTHKALLVEDDEINQVVAKTLLENIGFQITIANNGLEAVEFCKVNSFDIIFMDIQMPVMNGYDATLKIKEFDTKTPIVALSAGALAEDIHRSHEVGMEMHITKPIVTRDINSVIKRYFQIKDEKKENVNPNKKFKSVTLASDLPKEYKTFDLKRLNETLGDEDMVIDLLKLFANKYTNYENELKMIEDNDDALEKYVHKLKGASGNLKINNIFELCQSYLNDKEDKEYLINKIKDNLAKTIEEINTLS